MVNRPKSKNIWENVHASACPKCLKGPNRKKFGKPLSQNFLERKYLGLERGSPNCFPLLKSPKGAAQPKREVAP